MSQISLFDNLALETEQPGQDCSQPQVSIEPDGNREISDDFALFGRNLFGDPIEPLSRGRLSDRFVVPPFSVLDARQGHWQERKRAWIALGIKSELGRGPGVWIESETGGPDDRQRKYREETHRASPGGSPRPACDYSHGERGDGAGRPLRHADGNRLGFSASATIVRHGVGFDGSKVLRGLEEADDEPSGTSIFDPVLCELVYEWFCPPSGRVLDPFAGGSVRGITAALLGRRYVGVDLSERQLQANRRQAQAICPALPPDWRVGDAARIDLSDVLADLIFSCPPYGDLEIYSDDPADLSTMTHAQFLDAYRQIIQRCVVRLRENRFAVFVVGDFRDRDGNYRNFVSSTIDGFLAAGCALYNEAILVTSIGSLPVRAPRIFDASRKLGKTHQNVLVFVKGDGRAAAESCKAQGDLQSGS